MAEELLREYIRRCLSDRDRPPRVDEQLAAIKKAYTAGKNLDFGALVGMFAKQWADCPNWPALKKAKVMAWPNAEKDSDYQSELRKCVGYKRTELWKELREKYKDQMKNKNDTSVFEPDDLARWTELQVAWAKITSGEYPPTSADPSTAWVDAMVANITADLGKWWDDEETDFKKEFGNAQLELGERLQSFLEPVKSGGGIVVLTKAYDVPVEPKDISEKMVQAVVEKIVPVMEKLISDGPTAEKGEEEKAGPGGDEMPPPASPELATSESVTFDADRIIRLAGV